MEQLLDGANARFALCPQSNSFERAFDAMAEDVTSRWMGSVSGPGHLKASSWWRTDCSDELADGRRYDNNYYWVFRFQDGLIQEVREYLDTQLVTETFGPDGSS
jgi:ketosteroid isomerase-like protein